MQNYTREEVAKHNTDESAFIIIDTVVYDITNFSIAHPGGSNLLMSQAGKDNTTLFYSYHRQEHLHKYERLIIGVIEGEKPKIDVQKAGDLSLVAYGECSAFQGFQSPYYKESHHRFRQAVRTFYDTEIKAEAAEFEETGQAASKETYQKLGDFGILRCRLGPGPHLKGHKLPGGVTPEEFDYFHESIAHEESTRLGYPGYQDSIGTGLVIGLPPVMNFARKDLRDRVMDDCLSGRKRICLAVSEPGAGSDVAAIQTKAELSADGTHYIVNGCKKWITNGVDCDYFTVAVSTAKGISMLLIERCDDMETRSIKTSYSKSAGTSYIIFEDVKVPVGNLIGKEGQGFAIMMYNFNHERWFIVAGIVSATRMVVEQCFKWANQRQVFGKSLLEQPVIRNKLAKMVSEVEGVQNWLENMTFNLINMSHKEATIKLAGPIALLKLYSTRVAHDVSDDACQIFGGRAITAGGMGRFIEAFQRTYKFASILGGSEEIMADLGIRQVMKNFPNARL